MDAERVRAIISKLADVEETVQWGETLVFWLGDKAIGGKMFAVVPLDDDGGPVLSFSAGPERYAELVEKEAVIPAPYFARIHWVALEHWNVIEPRELASLLGDAHALTYAKLTQRTKDALVLPKGERRKLIEARSKSIEAQRSKLAAAKVANKVAKASLTNPQRAAKKAAGKASGPAKKKSSGPQRT